jgi:hypothetical protein
MERGQTAIDDVTELTSLSVIGKADSELYILPVHFRVTAVIY